MNEKPIQQEIEEQRKRGILLILTGPSGAGKDTVFASLLKRDPTRIKIITTTSRKPRVNEAEGEPYYFVDRDQFEHMIAQSDFFEWVEFRGELYGTQKKTLTQALEKGVDVIWRIEAKGVKNIKDRIKQSFPRSLFVFITAPSIDMMKKRVYQAEGEQRAKDRWNESLVAWEMRQYRDCEYLLVNEDSNLEETVDKLEALIEAKRLELLDN